MKKFQNKLTFEQACVSENEIWAKNRSDKKGHGLAAPIHLTLKNFVTNEEVKFVLPVKVPVPVFDQIDKDTMKNNPRFRRIVQRGYIELYSDEGVTEEDYNRARKALYPVSDQLEGAFEPDRPAPESAETLESELSGNKDEFVQRQSEEEAQIKRALEIDVNKPQPKIEEIVNVFRNDGDVNRVLRKLEECILYAPDKKYLRSQLSSVEPVMEYIANEENQ